MIVDIRSAVIKRILPFLMLCAGTFSAVAQQSSSAGVEDVQRDDDFVIVSLLVTDPGSVMYSLLGHAAIRMQCPSEDLDYVFSYESEDVRSKVLSFFAGKLKMGLLAIPFEEYLDLYRPEGRGVKQYRINLPIEIKRNLWRILDNHMMEGMELPYDYLNRGCANSALMMLEEGIGRANLKYGAWPDEYRLTRRELGQKYFPDDKWTSCFLHLICNGEIDAVCSNVKKVITPDQLVRVLSDATVAGAKLIDSEPEVLLSGEPAPIRSFPVSPLMVAFALLFCTVLCLCLKSQVMDYVLLAIQIPIGCLTVYLICFSSLVCTEWSWLIIPFNPLPLIAWKWRKYWSIPAAVICLVWSVAMTCASHLMTDWAFIVLSLALSVSYAGMGLRIGLKSHNE